MASGLSVANASSGPGDSTPMILTFAKLQRLSGLTKASAVRAWLRREGVTFLRDRHGKPFTTLDALNRKLQRSSDEGFTLEDPEGGVRQERTLLPGTSKQVDWPNAGERWSGSAQTVPANRPYNAPSLYDCGATGFVSTYRRNQRNDKAGI